MIIHPEPQGSLEWGLHRCGIPTASEMGNLLTDTLEPRKGQMVQSYIDRKLAEYWQGAPLDTFASFDMSQGAFLESEILPFIELETGIHVERVGFIATDDNKAGCSPDGISGGEGWELKAPKIETHIGYLRRGTVPKEYLPQIHASLFVTGWQRWHFVSYRRRLPALILSVERDTEAINNIEEALESFWFQFEEGKKLLIERNGGIQPKPMNTVAVTAPAPEYVDIIP